MNMKSMLFAGTGLFLVMTLTMLWMKGDVQRMRDAEQAKRAQACAQATQAQAAAVNEAVASTPTGDLMTQPGTTAGVPGSGATGPTDPSCPAPASGAALAQAQTGTPGEQYAATGDPGLSAQESQYVPQDQYAQAQPQYQEPAATGAVGGM